MKAAFSVLNSDESITLTTSISGLLGWLLSNLKPSSAVHLIESFKLSDFCLNSTIGSSQSTNLDDNISSMSAYERLLLDTKNDPLNQYESSSGEVSEGYSRFLSKVIDANWMEDCSNQINKLDLHTSKL